MNAAPEGRIRVRLHTRSGRVARVDIESSRPQLARRLMTGRTPEEAAPLAGLVFSLCGQAQRVAAQAACDAARGQPGAVPAGARRAVLLELAREHAWRLLLDWPRQAGLATDPAPLRELAQTTDAASLSAWLEKHLLGEPPTHWLARDGAGFDAWRQAGATLPARLFAGLGDGPDLGAVAGADTPSWLPPLDELDEAALAELAGQALTQGDFCAAPIRAGRPAETGALARTLHTLPLGDWITRHGRGAGARLLARLVELARLPAWLDGDAPAMVRSLALSDNTGVAGVETARGLLLHVVVLAAERIADYRILAPTEWNFHPAGILSRSLAGLPADDVLEARAHLACRALDPCVAFDIEVHHA